LGLSVFQAWIGLENSVLRRSRIDRGSNVINGHSRTLDDGRSAQNLRVFDHHFASPHQLVKTFFHALPNVEKANRDGVIFNDTVLPLFPTSAVRHRVPNG